MTKREDLMTEMVLFVHLFIFIFFIVHSYQHCRPSNILTVVKYKAKWKLTLLFHFHFVCIWFYFCFPPTLGSRIVYILYQGCQNTRSASFLWPSIWFSSSYKMTPISVTEEFFYLRLFPNEYLNSQNKVSLQGEKNFI